MKKKNILVIHCHDLGDYLGCYGTPVYTPNIDRLAEEGVTLLNHFSTAAVCSPSRASMWTGCYPHTTGLMGLVPRGWEMDVDKCPTLMSYLKEEGYQTVLFGLQHEHWDPYRLSYDQVYGDEKETPIPWAGGKSSRYIQQTLGTEWGRDMITNDLWLNLFEENCRNVDKIVCDDLRFPNEYDKLISMGFEIIQITRPGLDLTDEHASERHWREFNFHRRYENKYDVDHMERFVNDMMKGV